MTYASTCIIVYFSYYYPRKRRLDQGLEGFWKMLEQNERLGLLIRMLDPEDYRFVACYDFRTESRFRRERMRIYRGELRSIVMDAIRSHHAGLANINAAGRWSSYPSLVLGTMSALLCIGKLWAAGALFGLRLPVLFDLAAQRERLQSLLSPEPLSVTPRRSPV